MSHDRYFIVRGSQSEGDKVELSAGESRHLFKVVRSREGDEVTLLDGEGGIYEAVIEEGPVMSARIISSRKAAPPQPVDMAVPMLKAGRMDFAVEKCAELGVRRVIPFKCERSVWRGSEEEAVNKRSRFEKKVEAACKQSGNPWFTGIAGITDFSELVSKLSGYRRIFLADPEGGRFSEAFRSGAGTLQETIGIIGPEGGLADAEKEALMAAGASPVSLGPNRLRSETSAILLASGMILCGGYS